MAAVTTAAVVGAAGVGASMYGAKKQSKAQDKANKQNAQSVKDTNELNYQMWLESRGVDKDGNAINTKLPRWAKWSNPAGIGAYGNTPVAGNGLSGAAPAEADSLKGTVDQRTQVRRWLAQKQGLL
jgi:hypothetical protein